MVQATKTCALRVFRTDDSSLKWRNGMTVAVLGNVEAGPEYDDESLPMMQVRFDDGFEVDVWPDEIQGAISLPEGSTP